MKPRIRIPSSPTETGTKKAIGGFTLIETLVAMMIMALSLVLILQLFSGGLRSGRIAAEYDRAVFYARQVMEETLLRPTLATESLRGEFADGYRWTTEILHQLPDEDDPAPPPVDTFTVTVDVAWGNPDSSRHYSITTAVIAAHADEDTDAIAAN